MARFPYKEKPSDIHAKNLVQLKERIKTRALGGVYVFYGEEEYTKNYYFEEMCPKGSDKMLNVTSIYDDSFSLSSFMEACSTGGMETADMFSMGDEEGKNDTETMRVLRLVKPNLSSLTKKDEDFFLNILEDTKDSIIVFWFASSDAVNLSSGIYKKICERALTVNFKHEPAGSGVLITWILRHFSRAKIQADRTAAMYMCNVVGNDMTLLKNEIDKCIGFLHYENRNALTAADIDYLCIKSTEAQIFDVSNFALRGELVKALKALNALKEKGEEPIVIMSVISGRINELCLMEICSSGGIYVADIAKKLGIHEYAVKTGLEILRLRSTDKTKFTSRITKLCTEYDEKIKTMRDGFGLLSELVLKLAI